MVKRILRAVALVLTIALVAVSAPVLAAPEAGEGETVELTLEGCLELAAQNNRRLKLAQTALEKTKLELRETRGDIKSIKDLERQIKALTPEQIAMMPDDAVLRMPSDLDTTFYKDHGVWLGEQQVAVAEASAQGAAEGVKLTLINAYYDFLRAEADLDTARAAEAETELYRRTVAAQTKTGLATPAEDLAAETALAQARAGRLGAESAWESKRLALLQEIGLSHDSAVSLKMPELPAVDFTADELTVAALESSMDLKNLQLQHDVAKIRFDLVKSWYPSITYQYKYAEYAWLMAELQLDDTRLAIRTSQLTAYNSHLAAKEQLLPAERAIEQAAQDLRLVEAKHKVGAATELEVLSSRRSLAQAKSGYLGIVQGYALAVANLEAAAAGFSAGAMPVQGGGGGW